MKNKKETILHVLMVLPIVMIVISLFYLPDSIPVHYDANFVANRRGSKYLLLICGVVPILFGSIMRGMAQSDTGESNRKKRIYGGIIGLLVFNILTLVFIYNAFRLTGIST